MTRYPKENHLVVIRAFILALLITISDAFLIKSLIQCRSYTVKQSRYDNNPCRKSPHILMVGKSDTFENFNDLPLIGSVNVDDVLSPSENLDPGEIPTLLMNALQNNNIPAPNAGLISMWNFAGGNTHYIFQHNMTEFLESAHETAETLPTSFYGAAMYGKEWNMETGINRVGGESGWIATQVMKTVCSDGRVRRWQWELRKNKRPPHLGCWFVETIGSSDRKGNFEPE